MSDSIDDLELSRRLRQAREAARFTQDAVARRLGISRPALVQLEAGRRTVTGLELDRLARLYGRDLRDFLAPSFAPDESLVAHLRAAVATTEADEVADAVAWCALLAREFTGLENLLGLTPLGTPPPSYELPVPRRTWEAVRQGEQVALDERRRLGLGSQPVADEEELLESQGIRHAVLDLPAEISGLALMQPRLGFFVVVNRRHASSRRRFSTLHEYAHVLFDRGTRGTVSRDEARSDVLEVRANAFAATFLLPEEGIAEVLRGLGRQKRSRESWELYDEEEIVSAEARRLSSATRVQLYDLVSLARQFGTSRQAAAYRLNNLGWITLAEQTRFLGPDGERRGRAFERFLGFAEMRQDEPVDRRVRPELRARLLGLGLEAYRQALISRGKLAEIAELVALAPGDLDEILAEVPAEEDDPTAEELPEGFP